MAKKEISPREYYEPCTKDFRDADSDEAIAEWFTSTEPSEGMPTHSRILSTVAAEAVIAEFLHGVMKSAANNANKLQQGTRLQSKNSTLQPLAYWDNDAIES